MTGLGAKFSPLGIFCSSWEKSRRAGQGGKLLWHNLLSTADYSHPLDQGERKNIYCRTKRKSAVKNQHLGTKKYFQHVLVLQSCIFNGIYSLFASFQLDFVSFLKIICPSLVAFSPKTSIMVKGALLSVCVCVCFEIKRDREKGLNERQTQLVMRREVMIRDCLQVIIVLFVCMHVCVRVCV